MPSTGSSTPPVATPSVVTFEPRPAGMSRAPLEAHFRALGLARYRLRGDVALPGHPSAPDRDDPPGGAPVDCRDCQAAGLEGPAVDGEGPAGARWCFVGEAPGAEEIAAGRPFVGRAGRLLENVLRALGLERGEVFLTNAVRCRPPENRRPRAEEIAACSGPLAEEIEAVRPAVVVALGEVAAHGLGLEGGVGELRGRAHRLEGWPAPVLVTYHPAYLLRTPAAKRDAWRDLLRARSLVDA